MCIPQTAPAPAPGQGGEADSPLPTSKAQAAIPEFATRAPGGGDEFEYAAFISYRHVEPDRTLAKWLHTALETYRVPAKLVKERGLPPRLGKLFRDEDELPVSADLSGSIERALQQSRFLIVVCSPRTPTSKWVNAEVIRFRELGRHDQILALLIEGDPQEAFPQALREIRRTPVGHEGAIQQTIEEVEPLAADVRPRRETSQRQLRRMAKLRLLATLLGLRFDDLRQRDRERQKAKRLRLGAFLAAGLLCFGAITTAYLDQRKLLSYAEPLRREDAGAARMRAEREAQATRPPPFSEAQLKGMPSNPARFLGTRGLLEAKLERLIPESVRNERLAESQPLRPPSMPDLYRRPPTPVPRDSDRVLLHLTVTLSHLETITLIATLDQSVAREFWDYTCGVTVEADATVAGTVELSEGQLWPERKSSQQQLAEYQTALKRYNAMQSALQKNGSYHEVIQPDPAAMRVRFNCRWIQIKGKPYSLVLGEGPRRQLDAMNSRKRNPMPTAVTQDAWTNSLGMVFVPVPGMDARFCVGETRVQDYAEYAATNTAVDGSWRNLGFSQADDHPVSNVSWNDAQAFCKWLTQIERAGGKISGTQTFRLPLDWEWSMAVGLSEPRGGTPKQKDRKTPGYPWGPQWPPPKGVANLDFTLGVDDFRDTSPVGSFPANKYGLFDLYGNVEEWCEDEYAPSLGTGLRVSRGAWWRTSKNAVRSSTRGANKPDGRSIGSGFRVVLADALPVPGRSGSGTINQVPQATNLDDADRLALAVLDRAAEEEAATEEAAKLEEARQEAARLQPLHEEAARKVLWTNTLGMKFVRVPGTDAYFSVWETRRQDYRAYANSREFKYSSAYPEDKQWEGAWGIGDPHPVMNVSWDDARKFCEWLSAKERSMKAINSRSFYRLPHDWEWSVAVGLSEPSSGTPKDKHAQTPGVYPWGRQWPPPHGAGNYPSFLEVDSFKETSPVGSFAPNRYGIYDLGGNVSEWCEDYYDGNSDSWVLRGGDYRVSSGAKMLLSSCRIKFPQEYRGQHTGFRVVLIVNPVR